VRGGDFSEGIPLEGNWSEMLLTGRRLDALPVWVLTGVLSPPRLRILALTLSILDFTLSIGVELPCV
jgi:hypothetical protein